MALLSKVDINSVTIHDDTAGTPNLLINWEYERTMERGISELVITATQTLPDTVSLVVGQTVEVWKGFTTSTDEKVFDGYISEFEPDGGIIKITCKDKLWDLVRKNVNKVYLDTDPQAGQISAIAKDLIETYGELTSDEQATGTNTGETIAEFRCDNTDIYERLMTLADAVQYQVWYDANNDTVHFEPRGYNQSNETLTVGTDIIGVPKWTYDTSKLVNDLRVDGAVIETQLRFPTTGSGVIDTTTDFDTDGITLDKTPESVELILENANPPTLVVEGGTKDASTTHVYYVDAENKKIVPATGTTFTAGHRAIVNYTWLAPSPVHQLNQDSIDTYGKFEKQMTLEDVKSLADAEARTAEILNRYSEPFLVGECLIKSSSTITAKVGDSVNIVDNVSKPNIDQSFVVTQEILKYPGNNRELVVGDEPIKLADWQEDVEARIKRIEEQLSLKNQDLLSELRSFLQDIPFTARYRKIFKNEYDSGSGVSIWGLGSGDGYYNWNAGKWGTFEDGFLDDADHFIQQKSNSYTEDFIDTDFEDTNGTATWNTGSLDFTSGQIGLSSSIDFNNGTITTATLNTTESSGSFTYELTADGTNWESVTPGTAHTFSNTGTDLRWRITENAASTGSITQITLTNYH